MHIAFDVERCHRNWKAKFREPRAATPIQSRIQSDRGWQPAGVKVVAGQRYVVSCEGSWATSTEAEQHGPEGDTDGAGRLVACLLHEEKLSEPFQLDVSEPWTATADGNLYLRCDDEWTELSDNVGELLIAIRRATE